MWRSIHGLAYPSILGTKPHSIFPHNLKKRKRSATSSNVYVSHASLQSIAMSRRAARCLLSHGVSIGTQSCSPIPNPLSLILLPSLPESEPIAPFMTPVPYPTYPCLPKLPMSPQTPPPYFVLSSVVCSARGVYQFRRANVSRVCCLRPLQTQTQAPPPKKDTPKKTR